MPRKPSQQPTQPTQESLQRWIKKRYPKMPDKVNVLNVRHLRYDLTDALDHDYTLDQIALEYERLYHPRFYAIHLMGVHLAKRYRRLAPKGEA